MAVRFAHRAGILLLAVITAAALAVLVPSRAQALPTPDTYFLLNTIGSQYTSGSGLGFFGGTNPGPYCVATDAHGDIYVADPNNGGGAVIQKLRSDGTAVCTVALSGTGDDRVQGSYGIAVGPTGIVYAIDTWRTADNYRIRKFTTTDGVTYAGAGHIATPGIAPGTSFCIAVDASGNVYASLNTGSIVKYDAAGTLVATTGLDVTSPRGIAFDAAGDLYVSDVNVVRKFHTGNGVDYTLMGTPWDGASASLGLPAFASVWDLDVDAAGNVFVLDRGPDRVVKLSSDGEPITAFPGATEIKEAYSVAVSPGGAVYVVDDGLGGTAQNHCVRRYGRDLTGPVVTSTVTPSGWTNAAAVAIDLSWADSVVADQYSSGMRSDLPVEVSTDGGATWVGYTTALAFTAEGQRDALYRAMDAVGNTTTGTATARIDRTAPVTTCDAPTGWSRSAVTVRLSPSDALSGVARTEYSTNGGATWTAGASARISASGETKLRYRSTDAAGNVETAKTATVRVDGGKPVPKALATATARRGRVKLKYRVVDVAPQAKVTIKIYKGRKLKKTIALGLQKTNASLAYAYKCKLPHGSYTYRVYATDLAGNTQARAGVAKLLVR